MIISFDISFDVPVFQNVGGYWKIPENYSIKHWHNEQEYGEYQVHDEANRSPYRAFYVHPTWANTLIEVVDVVAVKMRIKILVQDHTEVNIYASYAMCLFGYQLVVRTF